MTGTAIMLPTDALNAMTLARELSKSKLVPQHFQQSPADIFMVMATCSRLDLDFFLTIGECYFVKNRLMFSGKLSGAIINRSGLLAERLSYDYQGEGNDRKVIVSGRLVNETGPRVVTVELSKVKTAAEVWTRQPDQQLAYAGARIWGRRHTPEVLLGMLFEGETIDVTPTVVSREAPTLTLDDNTPSPSVEPAVPEPREVEGAQPFAIAREDAGDWRAWAMLLLAYIRATPLGDAGVEIINEWTLRNADQLALLKSQEPEKHRRLIDMIGHQIALRQDPEQGER